MDHKKAIACHAHGTHCYKVLLRGTISQRLDLLLYIIDSQVHATSVRTGQARANIIIIISIYILIGYINTRAGGTASVRGNGSRE